MQYIFLNTLRHNFTVMDEPFADLSPLAIFLLILLMTHMCTYKKTNRLRLHYIFILLKAFIFMVMD